MGGSPGSTWGRGAVLAVAGVTLAVGVARASAADEAHDVEAQRPTQPDSGVSDAGTGPASTATVVAEAAQLEPLADPAGFQQPWGDTVEGLLTFRGNPTRSYHGEGPVPAEPVVRWRYPDDRMCSLSTEFNQTREWCGTGWTGQPAVFERGGRTWVVFGAYDAKIHFVDGATGEEILPPLETGDLAKGAITVDPDGYPLVYAGSRDNELRVIAIDRPEPTVLWSLDAADAGEGRWNDDWDAAPLVVADHLVEGGENSRLHVIAPHRALRRPTARWRSLLGWCGAPPAGTTSSWPTSATTG